MAALANPESRHLLGLLVVGGDASAHLATLSPARRDRVMRALHSAGLLQPQTDGDAALRLRTERFAELLAESPIERPTGIDRFVSRGRLVSFPTRDNDRAMVLHYLADLSLPDDEAVDETTLTERLATMTDDPVTIRRSLVDAGLVAREPDGSAYRRATANEDTAR